MQEQASKKLVSQSKTGRYKQHDEMDFWLDLKGFYRKHTARDATCLYRAIAEQIFLTQAVHSDVKRQILDYIARHPKLFEKIIEKDQVNYYVDRMRTIRDWGGFAEIYAASMLYRCQVFIWHEVRSEPSQVGPAKDTISFEKTISLCQSHERHYDPVYTKQYISDSAFCQSLMYETLYKKVFKLEEVDYAVNKMLHDKALKKSDEVTSVGQVQHFANCEDLRLEMRDCLTNVRDLLEVGIIPFPYKVAKSLDKEIYRNVEFDVWNDYRKGLRYGLCEWLCKELQVGVKCLVRMEGDRKCLGHIQEMTPNRGPVVVFVVELGQKISVPYESLELLPPPPQQKPASQQVSRPRSLALSSILNYSDQSDVHPIESTSPQQVTSSGCYEENDEYNHIKNVHYQECGEGEMVPDSSTGKVVYVTYPDPVRVPVGMLREPEARPEHVEHPIHYPIISLPPVDGLRMSHVGTNGGYGGYLMSGGYIMPPYEMTAPPAYESLTPLTPVTPLSALPQPAMGAVIPAEPVEVDQCETTHPEVAVGPQMVTGPPRVLVSRGTRDMYEGQPLIQQYEVSSSTGAGGPRGRLPAITLPAPAPLTPVYYQPVDICDHHCYPPPVYVDHFLVNRYPPPFPPAPFAYSQPEPIFYQAPPPPQN